ncbi:MAG: coproporphyrinogen III oxidase family protein, partial [Sulfurimonas sp.]|nr:coproporphyrinogen III oxidase family protein [Sulfurimonas sp.]
MLLYIHIPFCDSKCSYCAFNSYVDKFHLKEEYMKALLIQLDFELARFKTQNKEIESVFIGGGTPSTVEPKLYEPIFNKLKPYLEDGIEITSEANPNSATYEWLEGMYQL